MFLLLAISCVDYQSANKLPDNASSDTAVEVDIEEYVPNGVDESCTSNLGRELDGDFTTHFQTWLQDYPEYQGLHRSDLTGGGFGGLMSNEDCLQRIPVLFVHGNSDRAMGGDYGGWSQALTGYVRNGYRSAELYATTYANPETMTAEEYAHDQATIMQVRRMMEAVLEYTGSENIHVVSHSMGVTVARRAILGGAEMDSDGSIYDIGPALTESVETFIGIAGANLGLASCYFSTADVCGTELGLYPGTWSFGELTDQSALIETLNETEHYEGRKVYSIWGENDGLLGEDTNLDCLLYGMNSCQIPGQDDEYNEYLNHFDIRDETVNMQLRFLRED